MTGHIRFYIRSYNDLDNMAPLVYRLLREKEPPSLSMVSLKPSLSLDADFRVGFLTSTGPLELIDGIERSGLSRRRSFLALLERLCGTTRPGRFLFHRLSGRKLESMEQAVWSRLPLDTESPRVHVFDTHRSRILHRILALSPEGNRTVVIPHGVSIPDYRALPAEEVGDDRLPDLFLFNNTNSASRIRDIGAEHGRIMGAPRYCHQWSDILNEITPQASLPAPGPDKLRVAVMLSKWKPSISKEETLGIIKALAERDDVHLVIKPHTRGMVLEDRIDGPNVSMASPGDHSRRIIQWADVVLVGNSSILLDTLLLDVPLLRLRYTNAWRMAGEHLIPSCNVDSRQQLTSWIDRLAKDRSLRTYTREERDACLDYYTGDSDGRLLDRYADVFRELLGPARA